MGLTQELIKIRIVEMTSALLGMEYFIIPEVKLTMENGNQQTKKVLIMIKTVNAALFSNLKLLKPLLCFKPMTPISYKNKRESC